MSTFTSWTLSMQSGTRRKCSAVTSHCSDVVLVKWAVNNEALTPEIKLKTVMLDYKRASALVSVGGWFESTTGMAKSSEETIKCTAGKVFKPLTMKFTNKCASLWFSVQAGGLGCSKSKLNLTCLNGSGQTLVRYAHCTEAHVLYCISTDVPADCSPVEASMLCLNQLIGERHRA